MAREEAILIHSTTSTCIVPCGGVRKSAIVEALPELPEVETVVRSLAPRLEGRRIVDASFLGPRVLRSSIPKLTGLRIQSIRRHGKLLMFNCGAGILGIHLGMTGKLLINSAPGPYTRAFFKLNGLTLAFDDVRQFGSVRWLDRPPEHLGPDPLEVTVEEFIERLKRRKGSIKPLLLDQKFLRGVGNIYADESLFRARIHPRTPAARIGETRAKALHAAIVEVLLEAIERHGSSVSDYADPDGQEGSFQNFHRVYQRTGLPCLTCGTPIRRIVMGQRGTHYCPRCQKT